MSRNETRIPGAVDSDSSGWSTGSPNVGQNSRQPGTVVAGLEDYIQNVASNPQTTQKYKNKPIVGFLYSISRKGITEYWPIYLGANTIGSSTTCDVVLSEATVSATHAVLQTREMKNSGQIIAAITDSQSTNGTLLNGNSLGFTAVECKDGDIITIGNCYALLLILVNAKQLGMQASADFIPLNTPNSVPQYNPQPATGTTIGSTVPPRFNPKNRTYTDQTVGMDGHSGFKGGETEFMGK